MKNITLLVIGVFLFNSTYAQTFELNIKSSHLKWTGKSAVGAYQLNGTIEPKKGRIIIDKGNIKTLEIIIDMQSIQSEYPKLTKHLKSKDFFEVKTFKEACFKLTEIISANENEMDLEAEFYIKGIVKKEKLKLKLNDFNQKLIIQGTFTLDRTAYGVIYNSESFFDNLKDQAIADSIQVEVYLEFEKI